jgi:hypothetical protein
MLVYSLTKIIAAFAKSPEQLGSALITAPIRKSNRPATQSRRSTANSPSSSEPSPPNNQFPLSLSTKYHSPHQGLSPQGSLQADRHRPRGLLLQARVQPGKLQFPRQPARTPKQTVIRVGSPQEDGNDENHPRPENLQLHDQSSIDAEEHIAGRSLLQHCS